MLKIPIKPIYILTITVLLFACISCSKTEKSKKENVTVEAEQNKLPAEDKSKKAIPESNKPKKTAEQIEAEENYKKSKEYEKKIDDIRNKLDKKKDSIKLQIPMYATTEDLEQKKQPQPHTIM